MIRIVVKPTAGGDKLEREIEPSNTVLEVKQALAEQAGIPASDQRLIYKGQILKDERTVESYGIANDHVLHLVRGKPSGNTQSSSGASAPASSAPSAVPGAAGSAAGGMPLPGGLGGLMDPNAMQQMMQSPLMQQLLNNPDMLRTMLQMNPAVRELMDRDPQMAQLLNNPELLRESMNLMSNPNLMREYMRNNDRAISNIEALPGGFNALRQLYENVQEPLLNATTRPDTAANPLAGLLGSAATGAGSTAATSTSSAPAADQPGGQPLPNPWAPPPSTAAGGAAAGGGGGASGAGNSVPGLEGLLASLGGSRGMDMPALFGGAPGGAGNMSELTSHMLEDPAMRESMISMISQPGIIDMIASNNPQLQQMMNAMPGIRETMQNPEVLRMMLSPQMMRMATQMMQQGGMGAGGGAAGAGGMPNPAMLASLLSGAGGGGAAAGAAGGGAAAGGAAGGGLEGLMGMLNAMGMGGMGGMGGLPAQVADPATAYAAQIQQLQDMGFFDQEANIRALQATGGNVNAAVDRLLQGL